MKVRILAPGDEAILAAAAIMIGDDPPGPDRRRALLADPCFVAVAALDAGSPVGFIYGHVLPQMTCTALLMYSVDTAESHRRRGAARAMIDALKALCLERGYYEMWVLTSASNEPAMRLYQSCGGVRDNPDDVMFVFTTPALTR